MAHINRAVVQFVERARVSGGERVRETQWIRRAAETVAADDTDDDKRVNGR